MDIKILNLAPCEGWYFLAKGPEEKEIIFQVAAWAVRGDGRVVGMISASDVNTEENVACLVEPPPIGGMYLHRTTLTEDQRRQADDGSRRRTLSSLP